jgi:hypothetical protein
MKPVEHCLKAVAKLRLAIDLPRSANCAPGSKIPACLQQVATAPAPPKEPNDVTHLAIYDGLPIFMK